jgi:hypothetical protein
VYYFDSQDKNFAIKICNDDTILALEYHSVDGVKQSMIKVYNDISGSIQQIQELPVGDPVLKYHFIAADECQNVIVLPRPEQTGKIYILHKQSDGQYTIFNNHEVPRPTIQFKGACMHPSGYFFGIPREDGIDIWSLNADKTDYEWKGTSNSGNVISCDMNEKMIVMGS